jgi:hypothetical protein
MPISSNANFAFSFDKSMTERIIFFLPVLILSVFVYIYVNFPDTYLRLIVEDAFVENTQALFFLLSSIIGFLSVWVIRKSGYKQIFWLILMFAVGCLFIFFEEISWGQRIFDLKTPFYFQSHNAQHEITIHNMYIFKGKIKWLYFFIGIYGGLGWIFIRNSSFKAADLRRFIIPEWYCSLYFILQSFFCIYISFIQPPGKDFFLWPQVKAWRHGELFELLLALGFFLIAFGNYRKITKLLK